MLSTKELSMRVAELVAARCKKQDGQETPIVFLAENLRSMSSIALMHCYLETETQLARVLKDLQCAYRKFHLGDTSLGWNEVGDRVGTTLAQLMGDEPFQAWVRSVRDEEEGNPREEACLKN